MSWVLAGSGWGVVLFLVVLLRARLSLLADAEHELRGALTAIGLAAERLRGPGATPGFASLVFLQLDRTHAALVDLSRVRDPWVGRRSPAAGRSGIDAARLSQVVANLVDNAAEHGVGPVEVRWGAPGGGARVEIRNGNRPRELDDLATARAGGRGLGIATRAARELGGSLRVDRGEEVTAATLELPAEHRPPRAA